MLLKAPSFTSQDAKALGVSSSLLAYYVKRGDIARLAHGVYRGSNAPTISDFRWEDLVTAIARVKNGVICLSSALALYELTDDIPHQHWIAIQNSTRCRISNDAINIVRMRNMKLGRTTIKIDGLTLPIFDSERTIIDAFRYLSIENAIKALRTAVSLSGRKKINLEKIRKYAKILRVNIEPYLLGVST